MENKFRNHPSYIIEKIGAFWSAIVIFLVVSIVSDYQDYADIIHGFNESGESVFSLLILLAVLLFGTLAQLLFHWNRWRKTWIIVDESSLTISRNTINRSIDTIGIKNISNVNIERNIMEMIFGTSKVKIDTDSRSTADKTDVVLFLKKDNAEALRAHLLSAINTPSTAEASSEESTNAETTVASTVPPVDDSYDVFYSTKNVLSHCLFSASMFSILVCLAGILILIGLIIYTVTAPGQSVAATMARIIEFMSTIMVIATTFCAVVYATIKDFFIYYHFRGRRRGDTIQLAFGLFKQRSYEIPVNRIHSIIISRPLLSRLFKRCYVDLVCVGVGDEKEENVRLLLSIQEKYVAEALHRLLPEFDAYFQKQQGGLQLRAPKRIWFRHLFGGVKFLAVEAIAYAIAASLDPFCRSSVFVTTYWICGVAILLFYFFGCYLGYRAYAMTMQKDFVSITSGIFKIQTDFVQYDKIQYIELMEKISDRVLHMERGVLYILASTLQSLIPIPAFSKEELDKLVELYLENDKKYHTL